jgi:hypothetical protein
MHFYLPKPLHGWREFAGEVGIIVVGVLIALAAEQVVETVIWHSRAAEARDQLRYEVGHEFLLTQERRAVGDCIDAQLDGMEAAILSGGSKMQPLPLYREAGPTTELAYTLRTPSRSWSDSAWQSVLTQGLAEHLTAEERELLPIHYSQMARVSAASRDEDEAVGELVALAKPLPLDATVRSAFVRMIEGERWRNRLMANLSAQMIETIEKLGYVPDRRQQRDWMAESGTVKFCRAHGLPVGETGTDR